LIFAKRKKIFAFLQNIDIQLFRSIPRARAFHIWKKNFSSRSKKFFSKKFWRMKKRFYNAVYSKAKQQRPTGTEKTNKKTSKNKTAKRNRQTNPQERETKSLFCGKPIFVARTNENSPVRFGTIKEGVK
jgi:hypothetical protein